jgi:hypothetical protein
MQKPLEHMSSVVQGLRVQVPPSPQVKSTGHDTPEHCAGAQRACALPVHTSPGPQPVVLQLGMQVAVRLQHGSTAQI